MQRKRPPLFKLRAALTLAVLAAALAAPAGASAPPVQDPDDPPSVIIGRIGRCFSWLQWDFGLGGVVFQYGACTVFIPIAPADEGS